MAQCGQSHTLGRLACLPHVFCSLLEPVHGFVQHHPALPRIALLASPADAPLALPPRSSFVCLERRQSPHLHSRPHLFAWCVVLFSDSVRLEIPALISSLAPASHCDCNQLETPFTWPASRDPGCHGASLACRMGLTRGFCSCGDAQSPGYKHPPLHHRLGAADSSVSTSSTHVAVTASFELALGTPRHLDDCRLGSYFPRHRHMGLSKLFSLPECVEHGT